MKVNKWIIRSYKEVFFFVKAIYTSVSISRFTFTLEKWIIIVYRTSTVCLFSTLFGSSRPFFLVTSRVFQLTFHSFNFKHISEISWYLSVFRRYKIHCVKLILLFLRHLRSFWLSRAFRFILNNNWIIITYLYGSNFVGVLWSGWFNFLLFIITWLETLVLRCSVFFFDR